MERSCLTTLNLGPDGGSTCRSRRCLGTRSLDAAGVDQFVVDRVVLARAGVPREARRTLRSRRATARDRLEGRRRDRLGVERVEVDGGVTGDLAERRQVGARDRTRAGERLEHRLAEAFVEAG